MKLRCRWEIGDAQQFEIDRNLAGVHEGMPVESVGKQTQANRFAMILHLNLDELLWS